MQDDKEIKQEELQQSQDVAPMVDEQVAQEQQVVEEQQQEPEVKEEIVAEEPSQEANEGEEEDKPEAEEPKVEDKEEEPAKEQDGETQAEGEEKPEETSEATEVEENTEAPVEEVEQQQEEVVDADKEAELEQLRRDIENQKADLDEERRFAQHEANIKEANGQLQNFLVDLATTMENEFKKYGIDSTKTIEEIQAADPAKAQIAQNIISNATRLRDQAIANMESNLAEDLNDIVFTRASRLFEKYELTDEQSEVAADTFVNILANSELQDYGEDLAAKVELAVARARMIKPKVEKIVEDVKEVAKDVKEAIKDVAEAKADKPEEVKKEEKEEVVEEAPTQKVVVEKPTAEDFMDGAATNSIPSGDLNEDNVLAKLAALPFRERVQFMKDNYDLINRASAKASKNFKAQS